VVGSGSGGAGSLRDAAEGSLRACSESSERTFPLSTTACIRLDVISANTGAAGDGDGEMEALGRPNGGEGVEGLAGGWTDAARLTGSAWGLVTFLSLDEKGGVEGVEGLTDGWTELETVRLTGSAWGLVAFLSLGEKGGEGLEGLADG
jgi:hypothetical protein